ncbi:exodeoxyribonuclease V subunit beta [Daejeonella sp.]|uniref:UvrD-helicase domain-containing protein n=1 Tax=Daejeonella sp. TaxID=2805397 RepID=UPI0027319AA7|nr:UvrD-helicase domain-containing protein [Daejeonella sp.]MDP2415078.1 UvrD-helicase domain-containing protein [Daejeonella sp.]
MSHKKALKLVRASAGSGKTFALTAHYLVLLFSGKGKYREILAVTFTNKATAEMKERILGALEELARFGYEKSKFSAILKENYPELGDQEVRAKASEIYAGILHDYSRFSVSTIDGFVQQLIRSFAFELNIDSGYKLEMNHEKVKDELVVALNLQLEKDPELLEWVTGLAIDRINDGYDWDYNRALKELAGEIFKERYYPFQEAMQAMGPEQTKEFNALRNQIKKGIKTFSEEIIEQTSRIAKLFDATGIESKDLNGKTNNPLLKLDKIIQGDFARVETLRKFSNNFDQWPNSALKDTSPLEHLYEQINPLLAQLIAYYDEGIEIYNTYLAINKNSSYLRLMQRMADLLKDYRSEKRALLISDAQQLLKGITGSDADNPSFIWEKTGNKYKHFLFDEFQDTSTFQWMNFLPLLKNAIAEGTHGAHSAHLVVGDVKQSIYRWRNGDWRILHSNLKRDLLEDNVAEENLMYNRRSAENIIRFNNFLYSSLPAILQQNLNDVFYETAPEYLHDSWEIENSSMIVKAYEGSHQEITDKTLSGGKIEVKFFSKKPKSYPGDEQDEEEEQSEAAEYTIEKLTELLKQGVSMRDIGILVRSNREAEEILDCIFQKANQDRLTEAAGKSFQVISGEALKIMNNPAIALLLSTFRLLTVRESESGIFKAECARFWAQIQNPDNILIGIDSNHWMNMASGPISSMEDILPTELCIGLNSFKHLPVGELTEKLINIYRLGIAGSEYLIPFLLAFRDQVAVFAAAGDQGISSFLEWWDNEGSGKALPSSESQDAVQVMTVHKSKGLEFKAVIVPFLKWEFATSSNGRLRNLLWAEAKPAGFEQFKSLPVDLGKGLASTVFARDYFEEIMLGYMDVINTMYVATTRAKDYLCLICPNVPAKKKDGKESSTKNMQSILSGLFENGETGDLQFESDDTHYFMGELPALIPDTDASSEHESLRIHKYHVNEQLTERFKRNSMKEDSWFNAKQRKGIVMHKLLETLIGTEDLDKLISEKVQEGLIRESEREEIRQAVGDVLLQEEIKHWFKTAKSVISEKDMIIDSGTVKRPDKLFVFEKSAVLLDFKFGAQNNKYIADISLYRDNLMKMGEFEQVDAYLWYAQDRKLQKV